jgi:putative transposase
MVRYRRNRGCNGTYFFTVTLRDRRSRLLVERFDDLQDAWKAAGRRVPHDVVAAVVLPDHLHAVIAMRDGRDDYSRLWQDIKKGFTLRTRVKRTTQSAWQSRFWEHTIRDDADLCAHVNYVHFNPVKHGLVERVSDWPLSSFHRYVRHGFLPRDWGSAGS